MSDLERARRCIAGVFFVNGAALGSWAASIPSIKSQLGLDETELGLALLALALGAILAMLVTGPLNDRHGSRRLSIGSGVILALLLPLPAIVPSHATLIAALLALGAANGAMDVAMNAHGVTVEKALGRPILSSLHAFFSIGGIAAAVFAGMALGAGGTVAVNLTIAAVLLLAAMLHLDGGLLPSSADASGVGAALALPVGAAKPLALLAFVAFVCEGAMVDWSAVYLHEGIGVSQATAAFGFGVFAAGMAVGRLAGDPIVARLGRPLVLTGSAALALAGYWVALGPDHIAAAILGYALIGLGAANIVPILLSAGGSIVGMGSGTGVAAVATAGYGGALAGPALIGLASGVVDLRSALAGTAALLLLIIFGGRAAIDASRR